MVLLQDSVNDDRGAPSNEHLLRGELGFLQGLRRGFFVNGHPAVQQVEHQLGQQSVVAIFVLPELHERSDREVSVHKQRQIHVAERHQSLSVLLSALHVLGNGLLHALLEHLARDIAAAQHRLQQHAHAALLHLRVRAQTLERVADEARALRVIELEHFVGDIVHHEVTHIVVPEILAIRRELVGSSNQLGLLLVLLSAIAHLAAGEALLPVSARYGALRLAHLHRDDPLRVLQVAKIADLLNDIAGEQLLHLPGVERSEDLIDGEFVLGVVLHARSDGSNDLQQTKNIELGARISLGQCDHHRQNDVFAHQGIHEQRSQEVEEALAGSLVQSSLIALQLGGRRRLLVDLLAAVQKGRLERKRALLGHFVHHHHLQKRHERVAVEMVLTTFVDYRLDGKLQDGSFINVLLEVVVKHIANHFMVLQRKLVQNVAQDTNTRIDSGRTGNFGREVRDNGGDELLVPNLAVVCLCKLLVILLRDDAERLRHSGYDRIHRAKAQQSGNIISNNSLRIGQRLDIDKSNSILLLLSHIRSVRTTSASE